MEMKIDKWSTKIAGLVIGLFLGVLSNTQMSAATYVGMQSSLPDAIRDLMELDYDMVDTYTEAISRIQNENYRKVLCDFRADHERHIQQLEGIMKTHKESYPTKADNTKRLITMARVKIRGSDEGILNSMHVNEMDSNKAYERMNNRKDLWDEVVDIISQGKEDERRHRDWLANTIKEIEANKKPTDEKK